MLGNVFILVGVHDIALLPDLLRSWSHPARQPAFLRNFPAILLPVRVVEHRLPHARRINDRSDVLLTGLLKREVRALPASLQPTEMQVLHILVRVLVHDPQLLLRKRGKPVLNLRIPPLSPVLLQPRPKRRVPRDDLLQLLMVPLELLAELFDALLTRPEHLQHHVQLPQAPRPFPPLRQRLLHTRADVRYPAIARLPNRLGGVLTRHHAASPTTSSTHPQHSHTAGGPFSNGHPQSGHIATY